MPSAPPISVQLYSLREEMKDGKHAAIIAQLGKIGFSGVELAGLYGMKAADMRKLVADHGMVISSSHSAVPTKENLQEQIDLHKELGTSYSIGGFWDDDWKTLDAIQRTADKLTFATESMGKAGITFGVHNHWQEVGRINGKFVYDHLIDRCPGVRFELDTYWAANFGAEVPAEIVARYKNRTPLLHLKDGPITDRQAPHLACGKGKQDFPAILKAADPAVLKWAVVELDQCATDMVQAVAESYAYLVGKGLASGRVAAAKA